MKRGITLGTTLLLVLGLVHAASQTNAQTVANVSLNDSPYTDAHVTVAVPQNTGVTILARQGGWYHVRLASGQDGWVPMTSLRFQSNAGTNPGSSWDTNAFNLFESGRAGASGTTATTGVRGLNEGTIQNATPNPQAVLALSKYAATPDAARRYAAALKLKTEQVAYLPKDSRGGK
ncbi:MAG: SH3 domain-containing protein [Gammaproteobacteria bacterium]